MKCQAGDLAKIIYSLNPTNIGKIILVDEYIGHFTQGESFVFHGMQCQVLVTDHQWWISASHGLTNALGSTPRAYIADSWLEPIRPKISPVRDKIITTLENTV